MIITRTPFRISFFGGGTDYPDWYIPNGGSVLSTTIDKYCYLTVRYLPDVFEEKHRFVYSKIEQCIDNKSIGHPGIRECLKYLNFEKGLEIFHQGDLPARSGMATSSAFVVGLLSALYGLVGVYKNKTQTSRKITSSRRTSTTLRYGISRPFIRYCVLCLTSFGALCSLQSRW